MRSRKILFICGGFFLVLGCTLLKCTLDDWLTSRSKRFLPDLKPLQAGYQANSLKRYSLGFDSLISGLLWIQLIQNADHRPVEEDVVSWEFTQLDAITLLDPQFEPAYSYGAVFISFFRRDKLGGRLLLEKWVKQRPTNWRAHHLLGMHYFLELNNPSRAAEHVLKAATLPRAPEWIRSLGIRLLSEGGALLSALDTAINFLPSSLEMEARYRIIERIRSIRWNLQRLSWREALAKYRTEYKREPTSLSDLTPLYEAKERTLQSQANNPNYEEIRAHLSEAFEFVYDPKIKEIRAKNKFEQLRFEKVGAFFPNTTEKPDGASTK